MRENSSRFPGFSQAFAGTHLNRMNLEGPPLETLTRRLAETPEDFLAEPRVGDTGTVHVDAVVHDLLSRLGNPLPARSARGVTSPGGDPRTDRPRFALTLLLCWLLDDDWFHRTTPRSGAATAGALRLLGEETIELAAGGSPVARFHTDPDRREELARLALARFGARPAGETVAQAQDRLTALSSVERSRVLRASRAAEERARAVREALAKKAAQESADKDTRE